MRSLRFFATVLFLFFLINANAQSNSLDTTMTVELEEYQHFVWYKGQKDKPLLLILHGGPGKSLMNSAESLNYGLYDDFLVIHWDQRMTEKAVQLNPEKTELTMELLHHDTELMVDHLLTEFEREKLFILTHSWGSETGFEFAKNHPEKLRALIAISPVIDQKKNTEYTIPMLKKWAEETENEVALKELDSVNVPLQTKSDLFYQQKWLFTHNGFLPAKSAGFRLEYFGWMDIWFPLVHQQGQQSLIDRYKTFDCPIVIFEGKGDGMKVHDMAYDFYEHITAPDKEFVWFKKSGHTVFNTEAKKLQKVILKIKKRYPE